MLKASSDIGRARLRKEEALAQSQSCRAARSKAGCWTRTGPRYLGPNFSPRCATGRFVADQISSRGGGRNSHELGVIVDGEVRDLLEAVSRGAF
jgi:hypothetical protein